MNKEKIGYIELISAMFLSGTIGMFVEFSKQPIINVVFYRCAIGSVCLLIYFFLKGLFKKQPAFSKRDCLLVGVVGISVVLNWLALFSSYAYTSIGIATTIYHVQPIIVFFVGAFFFKEKITGSRMLWLAIAFLGVLLIINPAAQSVVGNDYFKGCILALIAACLYSVATLATKSIKVASPYVIALTQMLIGSLILWPFVQFSILPQTSLQYSSIVILGIVHSAFMYILLYSSYQKLSTSSIAILSYIYPLVAVAIDFIVFDKTLSILQIMGGIMVLGAGLCNKLSINPFYLIKKYQMRSL
jgi:drug/metabolite transporter (DMT)-like permease